MNTNDNKYAKSTSNNAAGSNSRYQRQLKGGKQYTSRLQGQSERIGNGRKETIDRTQARIEGDEIDAKFGFERKKDGEDRLGWLLNYLIISMPDETGIEKSALDLFFLDKNGENFKATIFYEPYFYIDISDHRRGVEISQSLQKKFDGCKVELVELEDLDLPNHLSGKRHKFIKISFGTYSEMQEARSALKPIIEANQKQSMAAAADGWDEDAVDGMDVMSTTLKACTNPLSFISDMREHDIPYDMRVCIDCELRVGAWFVVSPVQGSEGCIVTWQKELLELCEPRILAFDIECEKAPLKFPNAEHDRIYMISYMVSGQGYLIINREIVGADVDNFEYTPLSKYPGPFIVMNEATEEALLRKFVSHVQELRPHVIVTYNGDFFDWPYVDTRCAKFGLSLYKSLGIRAVTGEKDSVC